MKKHKFMACLLTLTMIMSTLFSVPVSAKAETEGNSAGLKFTKLAVVDKDSGKQIADLLKGEVPELSCKKTYGLSLTYTVPDGYQFKPTYLKVYFGNGLYVTSLDGGTFQEGDINSTGFEKLVRTPAGTGTAPYGYPNKYLLEKNPNLARNGELVYQSKNGLTQVSSDGLITFKLDSAYENQDKNQVIKDIIKVALGTESGNINTDIHSSDVVAADEIIYNFYSRYPTEILSKGDTTETIEMETVTTLNAGGLTKKDSKTTVEIVYPKDVELVSLEETYLYKKNGTIGNTRVEGDNKVTEVSWDEPGSYSGGPSFKPHIRVPADSKRAGNTTFDIIIRNLNKSEWNSDTGRSSLTNTGKMTVTVLDGEVFERIEIIPLGENGINWSEKKYDTYNVRLGSVLIKNELSSPTTPKTIIVEPDINNTAIIRGITVPYQKGMKYGKLTWKSSSGKEGIVEDAESVIVKGDKVSALIKNTALGLDINDSIKYIELDVGSIPGSYDGEQPFHEQYSDVIYNNAPYFWDFSPIGIFGTWKKGTKDQIISNIKIADTKKGDKTEISSSDGNPSSKRLWEKNDKNQNLYTTAVVKGYSAPPRVVNGQGTINKTQINGGDSFSISGSIDHKNWDWNPLQEPVLYVIMPEGFSYSDLTLKNGKLGDKEYVGNFYSRKGVRLDVWKYNIESGEETKGHYQPDFTDVSMRINMKIEADSNAAAGKYYINDFLGFTTRDFKEIGAVIAAEKWDHSNWNTSQYTSTNSKNPYDVFNGEVNSGETMVSLSDTNGINILQPRSVMAYSNFIADNSEGEPEYYTYNDENAETKKATTVVLNEDDTATMHIMVRNNESSTISDVQLFVPVPKEGVNLGKGFMPYGATPISLAVKNIKCTDNFQYEYIKLKDNKTYNLNKAPGPDDYEVVDNSGDADMILFKANKPLADGDGGTLDVIFTMPETLDFSYNEKVDIITPVLNYNLSNNLSTLSLSPAAITTELTQIDIIKKWVGKTGTAELDFDLSVKKPGEKDGKTVKTFTVKDSDGWRLSTAYFKNDKQGNPLEFDIIEKGDNNGKAVFGDSVYTVKKTKTSPKSFLFENKEMRNLSITKEWTGEEGADSVTVDVFANGKLFKTVAVTKANNWAVQLSDIPKYDNSNQLITYTINERKVDGYSTHITGDADNGFVITNKKNIPWTPLLPAKTSLKVTKEWTNSDRDHSVDTVEVELYRDGKATGQKLSLNNDNEWTGTFEDLQVSDKVGSKVYDYTVKEIGETGGQITLNSVNYDVIYKGNMKDGFTITNKEIVPWTPLLPAKTSLEVTKEWKGIDQDKAPEIKVYLVKNGEKTEQFILLNQGNGWHGTFKDLSVKDDIHSKCINEYSLLEEGESDGQVIVDGSKYAVTYEKGKIINTKLEDKKLAEVKEDKGKSIPADKPVTGDSTNLLLYIYLLAGTALTIVLLILRKSFNR